MLRICSPADAPPDRLLEIQDQKHEIAKQALSKDGSYAKSNKLSMKDVRALPCRPR